MKTKITKSTQEESGWLYLIQNFIENTIGQMGENVMGRIGDWADDLRIKIVSSVFVVIGVIFFLTGLAFYINTLTGEQFHWVGFVISGLVAMLTGLLLVRK